MITTEQWDVLPLNIKLTIAGNRIRGMMIDTFTHLEHLLADIVVTVDYGGKYVDYYTGYKTATAIIKDFFKCYPKIENIVNQHFTDKYALQLDLEYLSDLRNIMGHFVRPMNDEIANAFDGEKFHFYTIRNAQEECHAFSLRTASDYQKAVSIFVGLFRKIQLQIYDVYPHSADKSFLEIIRTSDFVEIKKTFDSIK